MAEKKERKKWDDLNAEGVIEQMQRDGNSPYWQRCSEFVWSVVEWKFPRLLPHLQEIIAQESLLRIHRNLATFRRDSKFTTWLVQVVRNYAYDLLRARKNGEDQEVYGDELPDEHPGYLLIAAPRTPEEMVLLMERIAEVQACLHEYLQLHAKGQRNGRILQLVLYDGYSQTEAAELLGVTSALVGTVVRPACEYVRMKLSPENT